MSLNRRSLLIAGSSVGLATLIYGCSESGAEAEVNANVVTEAEPDGDVALYDGSAIEPINGDAINNPPLADRPMGGIDATVTVVEYVSPTCPHCANFHMTALPQLKEEYIDTGRIRFIARPFRRNVLDLAVFMVAEASGEQYNEILGAYMESQNVWAASENPRQAIFEIAEQYGFTQERFEEVLTDQEMLAAIEATREQALNEFGLQGTPTFYINGDRFEGTPDYAGLSAEIENRL
ncbi:DsbA family protein [Pelagibacterium halotolerans]|uniref:Periplasmic thiol:disulfide interchange protein DsbA n=1 Tax=Pelagibacterium halotolerans (strain DSM 22347 / JCM 15775 / CGMCC 1.7692 / B2) TaxID=1082931 RepID=G4RB55_PELHB|nr:thioredoxin domain-containing protein [Pelagibacterium halotolerans]AEQ50564.1 periplasmic thiol:disulfide interchange protein DsbA [Pelagibacterium halotolerans B2]QJR19489.1 DsbA family protein [Pelagibacterium halotolerans]SDZ89897.1 Protein-disulfide isomerase [Pelagibacterium halotolerans]